MSLLTRIARLERETPPPEPDGCSACAGRALWFKDDGDMDDPSCRLTCEVCGREPAGAIKVLPRSVMGAL